MAQEAKYQSWIVSGIFGGLQKLLVPISSVFTTMILAHKALTKEEMGVWALFMTITSIVELIRQSLVKTSLIKYLNHSKGHEHKYVLSAAMFLNAVITILTSLVLFFFASYFADLLKAPQLKIMLYIFQVGMLIMIPFSHYEWLMYGKLLFKGLFWTYLFRQGISLLLVVAVYLITDKVSLNTLVVIYNIGLLAGCIVSYYFVKPFLIKSFNVSKEWVIKLLHFGKFVFGSGLSTLVFRSAEQMMLSPILGNTTYTASQNVAIRVINLSDIPSQTLGDILFPKSSRPNTPGMTKYYYEKTVGASLCFILPLVLFILIFPKLIIIILAGRQYYDAIPYLQLISFAAIFLAFLKQYAVIIDSSGRPQVNFSTITFIGAIHVGFCYYFIKHFGLMGAGYALLCSHTVGFIITQRILKKYYNVNFLNCFKYAFQFYPEMFKIFTAKANLKWKMQ